MGKRFLIGMLVASSITLGAVTASAGAQLTEQEKILTVALVGAVNVRELKSDVRWLAGIRSVKTSLNMYVKGTSGNGFLDQSQLPPILANLEADLRMTDIGGTLRDAGIFVNKSVPVPDAVFTVSTLQCQVSPQSRKFYVILTQVFRLLRTKETFSASAPVLVWEANPKVVANDDDTANAAEIRMKVREAASEFASYCGAKGGHVKVYNPYQGVPQN